MSSFLPGTAIGQDSPLTGTIEGPAFSPSNPALVAYSRQVEDTQELYLHNTKTGSVRQITAVEKTDEEENTAGEFFEGDDDQSLRRFEGHLAWRPLRDPDGRQWFAFMSSASETGYGLFVSHLTPEGELADRTIELPFEGQASAPTWSHDGRQLAFSGSPAGVEGNELFLYPDLLPFFQAEEGEVPAEASPVPLTENSAGSLYPDWSPNGQYIAYQSKQTGKGGRANWGISLLDLSTWAGPESGTTPRTVRLSRQLRAYHEYKPSWSPNGRYVAFYVSQSRVDASQGNRRQDIGVLRPVRGGEGRVAGGRVLERSRDRRLARNVLPNHTQGPEWHPSAESPALIYVRKQENRDNPIYLADVTRWSSGESNFARRLSTQFEEATRLHEEVDAIQGTEGLRLAFASQEGEHLRLQIQGPLRRTYRLAEAKSDQVESDQTESDQTESNQAESNQVESDQAGSDQAGSAERCRIQFAAKSENDSQMRDYKEEINNSLKKISVKIIKLEGKEKKYKLVSKKVREEKEAIREIIDNRIEGSREFEKIGQGNPFPKCYHGEKKGT